MTSNWLLASVKVAQSTRFFTVSYISFVSESVDTSNLYKTISMSWNLSKSLVPFYFLVLTRNRSIFRVLTYISSLDNNSIRPGLDCSIAPLAVASYALRNPGMPSSVPPKYRTHTTSTISSLWLFIWFSVGKPLEPLGSPSSVF